MPEERGGVVTFKGAPRTLVGPELKVGDIAPDIAVTGGDLSEVSPLAASRGKARLFVLVPSLDTSVCSRETKRFSDALGRLGDEAAAFVVSADLPFAQKRWCGAENVGNLTMLSDHRDMKLARAWGLYVREMGLFARAVYVIDPADRVVYREIVSEMASEPDYDAALSALREAARQPGIS